MRQRNFYKFMFKWRQTKLVWNGQQNTFHFFWSKRILISCYSFFYSFLLPMLNFVLGYNLMTSSAGLSHTQSTAQHPLHHSASANKAMMSAIFLSVFFTLTITKTMQRSFKMIVQVFYCLKFWVWIIVADFAVCFTNSCIVCGIVRYGVCKTERAIS